MWKCKKTDTADLLIRGYNLGEGKRARGVGSLQFTDNKVVYAKNVTEDTTASKIYFYDLSTNTETVIRD